MRLVLASLLLTSAALSQLPAARFIREIPWAGHGEWIATDTHIHTTFSDGANSPAEVAEKAAQYGCQAIAISDHSDAKLKAATPEYRAAVEAARVQHPTMSILAGVEWNVPPFAGDEHATVLAPPGPKEWTTLAEFKKRFDDYHRDDHDSLDAVEALRWLKATGTDSGVAPVVIYNHPSRKVDTSLENLDAIRRWRGENDLVAAVEGGPGHQAKASAGDYLYKEKTIDRWDPAVARIGDLWDTLLRKGIDISGAYASSDFHHAGPDGDYWPCQFSETWLYVPDRSQTGVMRALRAGAMFAVHGHIARRVDLTVQAPGLTRRAMAGEAIEVPQGSSVTVSLAWEVPGADWEGHANSIGHVELIGITPDKATILGATPAGFNGDSMSVGVAVPGTGIVIRARGRRLAQDGKDLLFYTNLIRITVAK